MGKNYPGQLVFGLDIGTRSIVGTVGYKEGDRFIVVAQRSIEHETRSMLDGQIHDIAVVGETILRVKEELEKAVNRNLTDVCIAAAGRVLRTVQVHIEQEYEEEREMTAEDIVTLTTAGIEKAYQEFTDKEDLDLKFYCVGFTMQRYYVNDYAILNPEMHRAKKLAADMIATFLPDDVVDGLYKAVGNAGLNVANLTLEPIAAMQVAIPQNYRMLNIALIDVGAGTSDICITKDGMIAAYGMIPIAGDSITEEVAQQCLVDFDTAELIKRGICENESVEYKDIMGLPQIAERQQILDSIHDAIDKMAKQAADKIKELNGDKPVSAVFVVGGGGKILGYTDMVAEALGIPKERVAVRGEDVMTKIDFQEKDIVKDSLLVTPVGICLSFYEQSNHFVYVNFNNERVKLYDNNHLTVMDAALQADFDNEMLFPRRGRELTYYVNGKKRMQRGELGEAAVIMVNGKAADMNTPIHKNDVINVTPSTAGTEGELELGKVPEINSEIHVTVNSQIITLPSVASVNGTLQTAYYHIAQEDKIEIINYYTVRQIAEFMDVLVDTKLNIYVNNKLADFDTRVYDNFSVIWTFEELQLSDVEKYSVPGSYAELAGDEDENDEAVASETSEDKNGEEVTSEASEDKNGEEVTLDASENTAKDETTSTDGNVEEGVSEETPDDKATSVTEDEAETEQKAEKPKNAKKKGGRKKKTTEDVLKEKETTSEDDIVTESVEESNTDQTESKPEEKKTVLSEQELAKKRQVEQMIAAVSDDPNAIREAFKPTEPQIIAVTVNGDIVTMTGKIEYVFVDIFDFIDFDLSKPQGKEIVTNINGRRAQFMETIKTGDTIEVYWKK